MSYNPKIHHRRSIRLPDYDYSQPGAYFVTLVCQGRAPIFGAVQGKVMRINPAGQLAAGAWAALPERFPNITLDAYVAMPNHFHGIIVINSPDVGAGLAPARPLPGGSATRAARTRPAPAPTIGGIVGAYKSIVTPQYIQNVKTAGWPPFSRRLWQRNYYEHIIRNETEWTRIRDYIENNPAAWADDRLYPAATPTSFNQD